MSAFGTWAGRLEVEASNVENDGNAANFVAVRSREARTIAALLRRAERLEAALETIGCNGGVCPNRRGKQCCPQRWPEEAGKVCPAHWCDACVARAALAEPVGDGPGNSEEG